MKLLNGHDLKKGDEVRIIAPNYAVTSTITHVSANYLHISSLMFFKSSGRGANTSSTGLRLERVRPKH